MEEAANSVSQTSTEKQTPPQLKPSNKRVKLSETTEIWNCSTPTTQHKPIQQVEVTKSKSVRTPISTKDAAAGSIQSTALSQVDDEYSFSLDIVPKASFAKPIHK